MVFLLYLLTHVFEVYFVCRIFKVYPINTRRLLHYFDISVVAEHLSNLIYRYISFELNLKTPIFLPLDLLLFLFSKSLGCVKVESAVRFDIQHNFLLELTDRSECYLSVLKRTVVYILDSKLFWSSRSSRRFRSVFGRRRGVCNQVSYLIKL